MLPWRSGQSWTIYVVGNEQNYHFQVLKLILNIFIAFNEF